MHERYFYEPRRGHGLAHDPIASIVGPRPIAWISTRAPDGRTNLAPYSFFGIFNYRPPLIAFASDGVKDTLRNVQAGGVFVVNIVTDALARAMNLSSSSAPDCEFTLTGLDAAPSRTVDCPRVAASPVALECELLQVLPLRDRRGTPVGSTLVLAEVVGVCIDAALVAGGRFDWGDTHTIVRGGGPADYYRIGRENLLQMQRPT